MAKALGIGGVFFRARDTKALAAWYETHLGVTGFWNQAAGLTVFAPETGRFGRIHDPEGNQIELWEPPPDD